MDVEANIRRMFEEGRREGQPPAFGSAPEEGGTEQAVVPVTVVPVNPPAAPVAEPVRPATTPPVIELDEYVPVPDKEITIRDLQDIGALRDELEAARRRKLLTGSTPAERPPPQ